MGSFYSYLHMVNCLLEIGNVISRITLVLYVAEKMRIWLTCSLNALYQMEFGCVFGIGFVWISSWDLQIWFFALRGTYRGNSYIAKVRATAVAACVYHIWNARNRAIFEGENASIDVVSRKVKIVVLQCLAMDSPDLWLAQMAL